MPQCGGHIDLAKENIRREIRYGQITAHSSRPSPDHIEKRFSGQTKIESWWFEEKRGGSDLIRGLSASGDPEKELESCNQWADFLNNGGLVLLRREIENMIRPSAWEQADVANVIKTEKLSTNWNFPQALAWVATRSFAQVTQINCDRQWDIKKYQDRIKHAMLVFQEAGQKRSLGWLIHHVSLNRCKCGVKMTDEQEAWEICSCTVAAFDSLLDSIRGGKLSAYDEIAAVPITKEMLPAFKLDPLRFELKTLNVAGSISFRRSDLVKLFPADAVKKVEPLSNADLRKWYESLPNPQALAIDDQMVPMAKAAFPDKIVSRDRVRALAGSGTGLRKTGPKSHLATK